MKSSPKVIKLPAKENSSDEVDNEIPDRNDLLQTAKYLEKKLSYTEAAAVYEKIIMAEPYQEYGYHRLMIIYRKQKNCKSELRVIEAGIKAFSNFYTPSSTGKHRSVITLSKKLNLLIGLTDKKGKSLAEPEPIGKWKKRKAIVLKKMGKKV